MDPRGFTRRPCALKAMPFKRALIKAALKQARGSGGFPRASSPSVSPCRALC